MKILGIAEARRRLPELVRRVSEGHGPVYVGRRGAAEVVLTLPAHAAVAVERRELVGLIEIVKEADLADARDALNASIAAESSRRAGCA